MQRNKVLAVTELISENDFFDYEAKYEGKHKEVTLANINLDLENKLKTEAKKIYNALNYLDSQELILLLRTNYLIFLK